ncbi:unnamed protein product, partial [Effrenium voratum]
MALFVGRTQQCLQQHELALYYDPGSIRALKMSSRTLRASMQGMLEVFCRFVRQPATGHNLMGAIWKLASLAPRGDERACAALSARLRHRRCGVRVSAVRALGLLQAVELVPRIRTCLYDTQGRVRAAAARTLGSLAAKNDLETLRAALPLLGDECEDSCRAAMDCICQVSGAEGNTLVQRELSALLLSPCRTERWAAVETLARTSGQGDAQVVAALIPCLEDSDAAIRSSVVHALRRA